MTQSVDSPDVSSSPESGEFRRSSILISDRNASIFSRVIAKVIDLVIVAVIYFLGRAIWLPLGAIAATAACAFADGLGGGQSIGKRIIGLRVIEDWHGLPAGAMHSVLRNLPFALAILLWAITPLRFLCVLIAIPLLILETYFVVSLDSGVRLGDVIANTLVIEHTEQSQESLDASANVQA